MADDSEVQKAGLNEYHPYSCAFCGEENEVFVDGSMASANSGPRLQFTEDCEICCRPNLISVFIDRNGEVFLDVTQEYEA